MYSDTALRLKLYVLHVLALSAHYECALFIHNVIDASKRRQSIGNCMSIGFKLEVGAHIKIIFASICYISILFKGYARMFNDRISSILYIGLEDASQITSSYSSVL